MCVTRRVSIALRTQKPTVAKAMAVIRAQMAANAKTAPLKTLQGRVWRAAYEDGKLKGEVYDDVPVALQGLVAEGKKVCECDCRWLGFST